ncbi:DUF362 domain-containing protein [bacterium]|nr:DUF362 domain-containing protein [bacterium]
MSDVAVIKCESYDYNLVRQAVKKGIDLLGGTGSFVKPGEKILLKPNLLVAEVPEKCVTTHPAVFQAVCELFGKEEVELSFGDSPAFGSMQRAARKAGLLEIAEQLGVKPADFKNGESVFFEKGIQNKKFIIAKGVLEADGLISLPKLKTHGLERMTGCIKNQFGCIPGVLKGEFHVKLPGAHDFGKMLVDLNNFVNPRLYIMDGIQAMEGNGPRGGKPKQMNVLLFSRDPVALDATVCRLVDLDPQYVPTIQYGSETGAGVYLADEITILGDSIEDLKTTSFDVKKRPIKSFDKQARGFSGFINNRLVPKPFINKDICTQCGTCVSMCPVDPKAVDWLDGNKDLPPVYHYDECIRCYCCQELCPDAAIELKTPLLRRIMGLIR